MKATTRKAIELHKLGFPTTLIADRIGLSKNNVSRIKERYREEIKAGIKARFEQTCSDLNIKTVTFYNTKY
tara:strand:- start:115 stop:327 length:213 start_codon:yes stop_codon:yes gene_type:complete